MLCSKVTRRISLQAPRAHRGSNIKTFSRRLCTETRVPVILEKHDHGIRVFKLNNPSKRNALDIPTGKALKSLVDEMNADPDCRVVILTGEGVAFSAGGDYAFLASRPSVSPANNTIAMRSFYSQFLYFRNELRVPIISAINGAAVGAGFCLALATDIRLASKNAKMGLNFVSIGIHPGMGATHYLPKLVGTQIASRLLLTGDIIPAEEAKALGLVLEVYDTPEDLREGAFSLARKIAQQSPDAVAATVRTLRMHLDDGLSLALQREADGQAHSYASEDFRERFINKAK